MQQQESDRTAAERLAGYWRLDPATDFLNHGSYGACPQAVLDTQAELRARMERNPPRFMDRELEPLLDQARMALAEFLGAQPRDLVWISNATVAVNTVLRSLCFSPGDELLITDHGYNACRNAVTFVAQSSGATVVTAAVPFPTRDHAQVTEAVTAAASPRTRLAIIDHVTSPTGMVWPIQSIVDSLQGRGIDVLVDGAHAPGMVPLDLDRLGAAYYTGNAHKWLCAPKGAAFLHVRRDRQSSLHPLAISHGFQGPDRGRSRFWLEFDWTGTADPTAVLSIPAALRFLGGLRSGGWPAWMAANHSLALRARDLICRVWDLAPPCPPDLIGSMATLPLPVPLHLPGEGRLPPYDPLMVALRERDRIEVPVLHWGGRRWVRISAQGYNHLGQYTRLADAIHSLKGTLQT